jgi:hypothetical protein
MQEVAVDSVLVLSFVMVVSCGGGGGFHPSVAGSKPLGQLSDADSKALCTQTLTYLSAQLSGPSFVELECRAVGVGLASFSGVGSSTGANATDAQIQATCQAGYALCKASPPDAGVTSFGSDGGSPADSCANAMKPDPACTATVDQYTACVNESFATVQNTYPPCNQLTKAKLAMLTSPDAGAPGGNGASGPACQAFEAACPGVSVNPTTGALRAASR